MAYIAQLLAIDCGGNLASNTATQKGVGVHSLFKAGLVMFLAGVVLWGCSEFSNPQRLVDSAERAVQRLEPGNVLAYVHPDERSRFSMEDYGGYTFAFHRRKRVYGDMEKICKYDDEAAKCILAKGKFSYTYNLVFDYERWWISSVDYSTELIMAWQSILNESAEASQQLRLLQEEAQRKKEITPDSTDNHD